jgi:hypothetical protein
MRCCADPEPGLEADQVVEDAALVLLPELHHGEGACSGARVADSDRLHRPEGERLRAAARHLLDRETALEVERRLETVQRHGLGGEQRLHEAEIFRLGERQVQVVALTVVVARGAEGDLVVDRIGVHDRGDGVVEIQVLVAQQLAQVGRETER